MELLAAIRPDDWNLALFVHILGAMFATGGLVLAITYLVGAARGGGADSLRLGFRSLLWAAIPGYIVLRGSAEWIYAKESLDELDTDPAWIGIGYIITDAGLLFLIIATVLTGLAAKGARNAPVERRASGGEAVANGGTKAKVATWLLGLIVAAYVVAIWAMTTKPV